MAAIATVADGDGFPFPVTDVPATAATPEAVVRFLAGALVAADRVDEVVRLVMRREELGSTGVGRGIAIPHANIPAVTRVATGLGRLTTPTDWHAVDGNPVSLVCLLLVPEGRAGDKLRQLERVVRLLRGDTP